MPLSELRKLTNQKFAESTTPLAASLTFDEIVEKLEDLFKYSDFAPIRDVLLLEGFAEEEMDEAIEAVVENVTSMQTIIISIPSHVYNYGLESLARRGDAPYHLGYQDLKSAISSVWKTDVLFDENRHAIVSFLYKKHTSSVFCVS